MYWIIAAGFLGALVASPAEQRGAEMLGAQADPHRSVPYAETSRRYQTLNYSTGELEYWDVDGDRVYNYTTGEFGTLWGD